MTKTTMVAALAALAAACGGGGAERTTKSFSYGPATAASGSELTAADDASAGVAASSAFRSTPDGAAAFAFVSLPDAMDGALGATSLALRSGLVAESATDRAIAATSAGLVTLPAAGVPTDCWVATATKVTFDHCQGGVTDTTGTSVTVTLDGSVSKAGDEVKWDLTATASGTTPDGSVSGSVHYFGDLTVTATSIAGFAESDKKVSISSASVKGAASLTNSVDFTGVTFTPECVTGGTIELKRIGSVDASGANGNVSARADKALKLTWQGCGTVLVQHSI